MTDKHTPGPWHVAHNGICAGMDKDGNDIFLATIGVAPGTVGPHSIAKNRDTAKANATLIAAAPDLLEALEAVTPKELSDGWWCPECRATIDCATNEEYCVECGEYLADVQPSDEWHKKALAAIAKAKGENDG